MFRTIPEKVFLDHSISAKCKLLLMDIIAFNGKDITGSNKVCFASNEHFAKRIGLQNANSVPRLLKELENAGYIVREITRDKKTNQIKQRYIFTTNKCYYTKEEQKNNMTAKEVLNTILKSDE